jgi:hypothetical protein
MAIVPNDAAIEIEAMVLNRDIALTPGTAVTVELKTGRRRLIDYFVPPVRRRWTRVSGRSSDVGESEHAAGGQRGRDSSSICNNACSIANEGIAPSLQHNWLTRDDRVSPDRTPAPDRLFRGTGTASSG